MTQRMPGQAGILWMAGRALLLPQDRLTHGELEGFFTRLGQGLGLSSCARLGYTSAPSPALGMPKVGLMAARAAAMPRKIPEPWQSWAQEQESEGFAGEFCSRQGKKKLPEDNLQ